MTDLTFFVKKGMIITKQERDRRSPPGGTPLLKMAKKIILRLAAILICTALLFSVSHAIAYKITKNKYMTKQAEEATTAQFADETLPSQTIEPSETTAPPAEETTLAPAPEETSAAPALWDDAVLPEPTIVNMPADDSWSTVLLNKFYKMNDTYEPFLKMPLEDSAVYLDERVADAFKSMYDAARNDGVILTLASGYVSLDRQDRNYTKQVDAFMEQGLTEEQAKARATFTVLPPGCSENNYGLAADIGWLDESFAASPVYTWLKTNAANFGFIERFPAAQEEITHFSASPWHWRYVGVSAAREMKDAGQCLEEYVGKVN